MFVRDVAAQHVLEDLGRIPSLAECLAELPLRPWMAGAGPGRMCMPLNQQHPQPEEPNEEPL